MVLFLGDVPVEVLPASNVKVKEAAQYLKNISRHLVCKPASESILSKAPVSSIVHHSM